MHPNDKNTLPLGVTKYTKCSQDKNIRRNWKTRPFSTLESLRCTLIVLLACGSWCASGQVTMCVGDGPCRCTMSDGTGVVDFSSLGSLDGTPSFPDTLSYDGVSYAFNPCFSFSLSGCTDAAVCKKEFDGSYSTYGPQSSALWSFNGYYPQVTYYTTGRSAELLMICDESFENPQLDVYGELVPGVLSMNLWTKCACPNKCKRVDPASSSGESLTAGSVMLIIFFSAAFVYLVAGMIFNYTRREARGVAMIPNGGFWATLPGLVKDGVLFTWATICKRGESRAGDQYDKI